MEEKKTEAIKFTSVLVIVYFLDKESLNQIVKSSPNTLMSDLIEIVNPPRTEVKRRLDTFILQKLRCILIFC